MCITTIRRSGVALVAAIGLGLGMAAAIPDASHAQPISPTPAKKSCKLPGGGTIKDGETGTAGGITYECKDGIGCQVENGKTTDKCSHMAAAVSRPPRKLKPRFRAQTVRRVAYLR